MKKLIRVFIVIFCLFFVLLAMPGSFSPIARHYVRKIPGVLSEATLELAESIDELMGNSPAGTGAEGSSSGTQQAQDGSIEDGNTQNTQDGIVTEESAQGTDSDSGRDEPESAENSQDAAPDQDSRQAQDGGSAGEEEGSADADGSGSEGKGAVTEAANTAEETEDENLTSGNTIYYYYTRISKEERLLYDSMLSLAQNFAIDGSVSESRLLDINPSSSEFAESYTRAYNAMISDHPELFWIAQAKAKYECKYYILPNFGGKFKIVLTLSDISGGPTEDENGQCIYQQEQAEMEAAADSLLGQADLTQSDAGIALQLHDLLIDNAWYNTGASEYDYAHTAYGALVRDSSGNAGGALCDGYALAYEYLMQKAGLTCIMVTGYAGADADSAEKHAWNLVQLDGDWYEVDPTWDDLDFILSPSSDGYDLFLEAVSDDEYISRIRHYMFNLTTEEISSFTPGDEYTYVSHNGWVTLLQPSVHIRSTAEESDVTRDYVTPLAPTAEGTLYTWEMLTGNE